MKYIKIILTGMVLVCGTVLFGSCMGICGELPKIIWIHADFPPSTILTGEDKGKGVGDKTEKLLQDRLTEYEHTETVANYKRIIVQLEAGDKVICTALLKSPEREKFIEFSEISQISFPNGIILKETTYSEIKKYLNNNGELDLEKLLLSDPKIGISKGRVYGEAVDTILAKHKNNDSVYERSGTDIFKGLIKMMLAGRIDMVLGYPQEFKYVAKEIGNKESIMYLPVKGMPDYLPVYIGAPKNAWGKAIIKKINSILLEKRHTEEYLKFYEDWIYENSIPRYRQVAKQVYGK